MNKKKRTKDYMRGSRNKVKCNVHQVEDKPILYKLLNSL